MEFKLLVIVRLIFDGLDLSLLICIINKKIYILEKRKEKKNLLF
jgi:hypothetical protein